MARKSPEAILAEGRRAAQTLAAREVDRYVAEITTQIPSPGFPDVNLVDVATEMEGIIQKARLESMSQDARDSYESSGWDEADVRESGFLLGLALGRRLGGAR